ncbi:uncharacterized protein BX664DRAFT_381240 [Halteromyces radiatus]|uniref:uncharacterized protein n=1 Tax=Halteromyces radiatus TaxID=101107 RepID=UPI00221EBA1E|nr:uncharacterized protein BX664DRAFT_381240 [Halteromyces radiatus]KAI8098536.1 hypothetical protein BX664DRAFT_381240 [Halteromyces radiatus]
MFFSLLLLFGNVKPVSFPGDTFILPPFYHHEISLIETQAIDYTPSYIDITLDIPVLNDVALDTPISNAIAFHPYQVFALHVYLIVFLVGMLSGVYLLLALPVLSRLLRKPSVSTFRKNIASYNNMVVHPILMLISTWLRYFCSFCLRVLWPLNCLLVSRCLRALWSFLCYVDSFIVRNLFALLHRPAVSPMSADHLVRAISQLDDISGLALLYWVYFFYHHADKKPLVSRPQPNIEAVSFPPVPTTGKIKKKKKKRKELLVLTSWYLETIDDEDEDVACLPSFPAATSVPTALIETIDDDDEDVACLPSFPAAGPVPSNTLNDDQDNMIHHSSSSIAVVSLSCPVEPKDDGPSHLSPSSVIPSSSTVLRSPSPTGMITKDEDVSSPQLPPTPVPQSGIDGVQDDVSSPSSPLVAPPTLSPPLTVAILTDALSEDEEMASSDRFDFVIESEDEVMASPPPASSPSPEPLNVPSFDASVPESVVPPPSFSFLPPVPLAAPTPLVIPTFSASPFTFLFDNTAPSPSSSVPTVSSHTATVDPRLPCPLPAAPLPFAPLPSSLPVISQDLPYMPDCSDQNTPKEERKIIQPRRLRPVKEASSSSPAPPLLSPTPSSVPRLRIIPPRRPPTPTPSVIPPTRPPTPRPSSSIPAIPQPSSRFKPDMPPPPPRPRRSKNPPSS